MPELPLLSYFRAGDLATISLNPQEIAAVETLNRKLAAGQTLAEILKFLFAETSGVCEGDRLSLAFIEEDGRRAVSWQTEANYTPLLLCKGFWQELATSSLKKVFEEGSVRIISDLEAYGREHPASPSAKLLLREGVRSSITCPLSVEGRRVGFFFRSSRKPGAYSERNAALHLAISERLGQAVEKAWLIEKLSAAKDSYMEMLSFVSHELKSPLASIIMDAQLLTGGYSGDLQEAQKEKLGKIISKSRYLMSLVGDYLNLARLEGGAWEMRVRAGVLIPAELLGQAVSLVEPQILEAGMRLSVSAPDDLRFDCDPDLLLIALANLMSNAVKYGKPGGQIELKAGLSESGALRVSVWNEGPGFPASEKQNLFRKFSRLKVPELQKRKGSGVGLYTSWRLVGLHGGSISADSEEGKWAEFVIVLPPAEGLR